MNSPKAPSGHGSPQSGVPRLDVSPFALARVARARLGPMPLLEFRLASRNVGKDRCCLCVQYFSGSAPSTQCRRCSETVCQRCICACCLCQEIVCGFCRAKSMNFGDAPGRRQAEEAMRFRVCNACVDRFATTEEDQAPVETWQRFHEGRFRHLHARPTYAMHMALGPLVVASGNKPIAATNVTLRDLGLFGGEEAEATMSGDGRSERASVGMATEPHSASSGSAGCPTGPASAIPDPIRGPAPSLALTPAAAPTAAPTPAPVPLHNLASRPMLALDDPTPTEDTPLKRNGGRSRDGFATNDTSPLSSRSSSLSSKSLSSLLAPGSQAGEMDGKGAGYPQEASGGVVELRQMWESLTVRGVLGAERTPSSPTTAAPADPADPARSTATPTPAFPRPSCSAPETVSEREARGAGGDARHEVAEKDVGTPCDKRDGGETAEGESEPGQESKGWRTGYKRGLAYGGFALAVGVAVWAISGRPPRR